MAIPPKTKPEKPYAAEQPARVKLLKLSGVVVGFIILFVVLAAFWFFPMERTIPNGSTTNYEQCVAAGYGIIKTLPPQCQTPEGKIFVQGDKCPFIDCAGSPDKPICKNNQCVAISSFEECVAAGYPIMESYPEQCRMPDGKTFTRKILTGCASDAECTQGYFCKLGICTEFVPDTSCQTNDDCQLIDITNRFSCCYIGYCDFKDYPNSKWSAVNAKWFSSNQQKYCPTTGECGPFPNCYGGYDPNYTITCINSICQKTIVSHCTSVCEPYLGPRGPLDELTACDIQYPSCTALTNQTDCENGGTSEWLAQNPDYKFECKWITEKTSTFSCHVASKYSTASGLAETIEQRCRQKNTQTECLNDAQCQWVLNP